MPKPRFPELRSLIIASALAMYSFGSHALKRASYIPRQPQVEYRENNSGWPSTVRETAILSGSSKFVAWSRLFGAEKNQIIQYDTNDVPELQNLIAFVIANRVLANRISPLASRYEDKIAGEKAIAGDAVGAAANILERADALGDVSEESLSDIYSYWEKGVLSETVSGDLLFPILLCNLQLEEPLVLAEDITIEPITKEIQRARALSMDYSREINPFLGAAATHAVVLHGREFQNESGPMFRRIQMEVSPPELPLADQVFEALSIVTGLPMGYGQVCLLPKDWAVDWLGVLPPLEQVITLRRYPPQFDQGGWNRPGTEIKQSSLASLPSVFKALRSSSPQVQLAARRLAQSARREQDEDVVLDACIGLEALIGQGRDELSHRMGLRAATALSEHDWDPKRVYDLVKKVYAHRSKIVHGTVSKESKIRVGEMDYAPSKIAVSLLNALLDANLSANPMWTPEDLDAKLLEQLRAPKRSK